MQMTHVAILPVTTDQGSRSYHAIAGTKHSSGVTAGAALDALTAQLSADETSTLVIVQSLRPDKFFSAAQHQLLEQLMARWRVARDHGMQLPAAEQAALESLIEIELHAATQRAAALADDIGV
jgi:hypothetical protein